YGGHLVVHLAHRQGGTGIDDSVTDGRAKGAARVQDVEEAVVDDYLAVEGVGPFQDQVSQPVLDQAGGGAAADDGVDDQSAMAVVDREGSRGAAKVKPAADGRALVAAVVDSPVTAQGENTRAGDDPAAGHVQAADDVIVAVQVEEPAWLDEHRDVVGDLV